ncbi:MAG TPA: thiol peroxidase [Syntrophales bacterium]|nr:thiol peroxidase [Syntrophales bacterium]
MISKMNRLMIFSLCLFVLYGCAITRAKIPIDNDSIQPGTSVTMGGKSMKLLGKPIAVGDSLPSVDLVDAMTMKPVDLSKIKGSILFLSIVPSVDTPVCEAQTHYLGEEGNKLAPEIIRIAISRDTPFAQKRFAKEAKLEHMQFLSDYKEGAFGRANGLLMDGLMLLARSVIIVDREGKVRYIQVVPEITHLPDMERAFQKAGELVK